MVSSCPNVSPEPTVSRRAVVLLGLAALQLVVLSSVWPAFRSPNEWSRIYAAHAFVERGTWCVDREVERYGFLDDLARVDGHLYSNKAPGLIWAAVPVVAAVRAVAPRAGLATELLVSRIVLVTGSALVAAAILALWTGRRRGGGTTPGGAVFVLLFATPFAVYAGTFFSHAWAGALLLAAAWLLLGSGSDRWTGEVLGGFLLGLAAVSEYPAVLVAGPLALAAAWGRPRRFAWITAGGLLPLGALGLYDRACFGSPFLLASRFEAYPRYMDLAHDPTFGFALPRLEGLAGLLVSPLAGLLLFAPVLLPALASPVIAWRRGDHRLAVVLASGAWVLPLVMSGYREWPGGAAFGPRYLVLGIPFVVLGLAMLPASVRLRVWLAGAGAASALVALAGRLTPPFAIDAPWWASTLRGWTVPALRSGLWNPPAAGSAGLIPAALVLVVAVWLAAALVTVRDLGLHRRQTAAAAALAAILLTAQLLPGRVVERQRRWFRRMAPVFRARSPETADPPPCHDPAAARPPAPARRRTRPSSGFRSP